MIMLMMAMDDKTEKPTPKKKKDAREKGQVLKSNDINTAFILLAMFAVLKFFGSYTVNKIELMLSTYLTGFNYNGDVLPIDNLRTLFINSSLTLFTAIFPILLASVIASLLINYLQVGFLLSTKALKPDFGKINPISGMKRLFSIRSLVELLKSLLKSFIIGYLVYNEVKKCFNSFPMLMNSDLYTSLKYIVDLTMGISFKVGLALLILGAFDFLYQWWDHQKQLRMSKQEVKEEYKQSEGDPKIKSQIRQRQQQMGMMRMMNDVPKADVIIVNPTHFAVALKYDEKKARAPIVLAKGQDFVALRIKEKARENKIKIIENKPLAQALFASVEIGEQIPQEFYVAVAEILAEIYAIKNK